MNLSIFTATIFVCAASVQAASFQTYQEASVVLGQQDFTGNAVGSGASGFTHTMGVAVDPTSGKVFVSDWNSNRVLRFSSMSAVQSGSSAEAVFGQPDFTSSSENQGQGSTPAANTLSAPEGLAVDSSGRLWVADTGNNRVLRFDNASTKSTNANADGVLGRPYFTDDLGGTSLVSMYEPKGVSVDHDGHLWVADTNHHRVLRFDNAASKANGVDPDGMLGQKDFSSLAPNTTSAHALWGPSGVYADAAGRLWVADTETGRVLRFDAAAAKANGSDADAVLGKPDFTTYSSSTPGADSLSHPYGLVLDGNGTLWVADYGHSRVCGFPNAASLANGAAAGIVLGQPDFTTTGWSTTNSKNISGPRGLALDAEGGLWVADSGNHRALYFSSGVMPNPTPEPSPSPTASPSPVSTGTPTLDIAAKPRLSVAISGRKEIATSQKTLIVAGSAKVTNGSLARVEVKIGRTGYKPARGAASWKFTAKLKPGKNVILVRAIDASGVVSATKKIVVLRK